MARTARLTVLVFVVILACGFHPHPAHAGGTPIQTLLNTNVHVAAVWEADYERFEVFVVGDDGAVHVIGKHHDSPWWPSATISGPNLAPPGAALTAVFEPPHWTEVFYVGNEGAVWELLKIDDGAWRAPKKMSPSNFAPAGSSLTAVWQTPHNRLDVFIVDSSHSLRRITRTGPGDFDMPPPITGNDFGREGSPLTSVYFPDLDQTQVFEVGQDGTVLQVWRAGDGDWKTEHLSQPNFAPAFAPISGVYYPNPSDDAHVEVFVVGNDGILRGLWQTASQPWKSDITLSPPGFFSTMAPVSAVYQPRNKQLEVFAFGKDGTLFDAWKGLGIDWNQAQPLPGPNFGRDLAPLAAVSQDLNEHLEVIGADTNAALHTSWKAHNGNWNPPAPMTGQFLSTVIRPARCTQILRSWSTGDPGYQNDLDVDTCAWVMGIGEYCDSKNQFAFPRGLAPNSNDPPYGYVCADRFHPDQPLEQAQQIIQGVQQGLETAAEAVMAYAPEIAQGTACVGGQIYACFTLAIDIAHRLGLDVPGAVGDAVTTATRVVACADGDPTSCTQLAATALQGVGVSNDAVQASAQAGMCVDGDIDACGQLGLRAASATGVTIPGFDPSQVAAEVQQCLNTNDPGSFAACSRVGLRAASAAGLPPLTAGGAVVNATDCMDGNDQACFALGQRAARAAGVPIQGVLQGADTGQRCANGDKTACTALGRLLIGSAVPDGVANAQKCVNNDDSACTALARAVVGAGLFKDKDADQALRCQHGVVSDCLALGKAFSTLSGVTPLPETLPATLPASLPAGQPATQPPAQTTTQPGNDFRSKWELLDNNPNTVQIVADGSRLYQRWSGGQIWQYTGTGQACQSQGAPCPGWTQLDNNSNTAQIAASGGHLYQRWSNGQIWGYTGTPCQAQGTSCTGWQKLGDPELHLADICADGDHLYDRWSDGTVREYQDYPGGVKLWRAIDTNTNTAQIACGGGKLYQRWSGGQLWQYTGTPMVWTQIDGNQNTVDIVAGDQVYQRWSGGQVWQYTGQPCQNQGTVCAGWQQLDGNKFTAQLAAAGGHLYQRWSGGQIWGYTGSPCQAQGTTCPGWTPFDDNTATVAIAAGGDDLYQLHRGDSGAPGIWKHLP